MAIFEYQALTTSGRLMQGTIEAAGPQQAQELLGEMKLSVSTLEKAAPPRPRALIGRNEFLLFNQQLASLAKTGMPLERGLRELSHEVMSRAMRQRVAALADDLEKGRTIEEAFTLHRQGFPVLYSQILKAGVHSGRLSEMLTSLNRHLEMAGQTRRLLFEAMCYPLVVLTLAAVIVTAIFLLIVPQFKHMYRDFGIELPALTQFIMTVPDYVGAFWAAVVIIAATLTIVVLLLKQSSAGRYFREGLLLKMPFFGRLYRSSLLSRFADSMGLLVSSNADLPTCLRLSAGAIGSERLKRDSDLMARAIEQGNNIMESGAFCSVVPRLFTYSMQLGTQRNELQDSLYGLSDMYSQQVHAFQGRLQAVLLPLMLIGVGVILAMVILSVFLPLVTMISKMSG